MCLMVSLPIALPIMTGFESEVLSGWFLVGFVLLLPFLPRLFLWECLQLFGLLSL